MKESEGTSPSDFRSVLVFFKRDEIPDIDLTYENASLDKIRQMHAWYDRTAEATKSAITKIGGRVLEESWFWAGLRASLPADELEIHMDMLRQTPNVSGVHFPE